MSINLCSPIGVKNSKGCKVIFYQIVAWMKEPIFFTLFLMREGNNKFIIGITLQRIYIHIKYGKV